MGHAYCSPSGAHRWLVCTAAPHFEDQFPPSESEYAAEGTLAHSVMELHVQKTFLGMTTRTFNSRMKKLHDDPLWRDDPVWEAELENCAKAYIEHISTIRAGFSEPPFMAVEVEVQMKDVVPEGYGRCDCLMVGGDTLAIVDYKHGQGVLVDADHNPQLMLYALGALNSYGLFYNVKKVSMSICQPRGRGTTSKFAEMTVDELREWAESIKPRAQEAYHGPGTFVPGEHCRFCRGKQWCKARAYGALEAAKFEGRSPMEAVLASQLPEPLPEPDLTVPKLTLDEIGELMQRGAQLKAWLGDMEEFALKTILEGEKISGFKVVEGKSTRKFRDPDKALDILQQHYDKALLYDYVPKSLAQLEKVVGRKDFGELLSKEIFVPKGKPTLVPETDPRPEFSSGDNDFSGLITADASPEQGQA